MRIFTLFLFALVFVSSGLAQTKPPNRSPNVQVETTEDGATSELLPITLASVPALSSAKIGFKYFGVKAASDVSVVLILKGDKFSYAGGTFGAKIIIDGIPLKANSYRSIDSVDKKTGEEILHFYMSVEEIAWLATADKLVIELYNVETDKKSSAFSFTPQRLKELKDFAKSILLIKSYPE